MRFFNNILSITAFVLLATLAHANTVPVSWESVQGADAYRVTVTTDEGSVVSESYTTNTSKNLNGLQSGEIYRCTITPLSNGGQDAGYVIQEDLLP